MKNSTLSMTHEEWLKDRRNGIGGSDVATILGLNKWKSPYQLWLDKTGQLINNEEQNEPAYWGNVLEEVVAKEFTERTGKKVRKRNQVFEHPLHPFLRANIDRDVVGENAILECKTANAYLANEWDGDEIPQAYLCQVQHYMNVLNRQYVYIAVLIGGQRFVWKKIERDQELIDLITERLVNFWEINVLGNIEPPIDGSAAATVFLKDRYKDIDTKEVSLGVKFDDLVHSRIDLKRSEKEIKTEIKRVENEIIQELGKNNASIGITPNFVIDWKQQQRKSIDKNVLKEKYPDILADESIYKVSTYRTLKEKEI
ncbi:YqaJ viral recombinase family protein [Enterococcus wangshanyuanii]|uniref:YqaJ viral recombinase domain-containing protein n=1 Tax=Enterococcus wangshanyuanii TaxID=2005703 RepID=A0ABQ1PRR6_9ENTE|nr:YqaJ viral recombinase family protein [Enterococcus wangshanyuanii]GGD02319.1 hypothetical protein GCM10011573_34690 [Enterococcus wangshanyuanii]